MPAIQPTRLKQQAALLAENFHNPAAFVHNFQGLLEFYADRVKRPGHSGKPAPLTTAYKVHTPVLRQVLLELSELVVQSPGAALALCDALWDQSFLEFRMLAAMLLGQVPISESLSVIGKIQSWLTTDLEDHLVDALLEHALKRIRLEDPQSLTQLIGQWLNSSNLFYQQIGLRTLLPVINEPYFQNLPNIYRLIYPLIRTAPIQVRPDLLDVVSALVKRSPQETAYYLRQNLSLEESPDTPWIVRQVLHDFPEEIQKSLRELVRESGRRKKPSQ